MKLVFEGPIQAGALFTKDGSEPFQLVICSKNTDGCIEIHMSNDDAKEILGCLQESFSDELSTPPATDPRDALIKQMGEALERCKWTLEKFADDKNDDSASPTASARVAQDEPYIHLNMVESALSTWQKFKEGK